MGGLLNVYGVGSAVHKVLPPPIIAQRAPTTTDTNYPIGQPWIDESTSPPTYYVFLDKSDGTWQTGGNEQATTSSFGITQLATLAELQGGTAPAGAYVPTANDVATVISGVVVGAVPPASEVLPGIAELATQAETNTGTDDARIVTPLKLKTNLTTPPAIGGTTPSTGAFTTLSGTTLAVSTSATVGTTLGVTGLTTLGALTQVGTASINASGAATTTIGTGGTGATNIGNATGNTAVTGSLTASTSLTATLGNITATNGNIVRGTAGNKDVYTSVASTTAAGANSAGSVTLVGGTATVATTAVTANSLIRMTRQGIGATGAGALGVLTRGTLSAGVSFVINAVQPANASALQASDVSVVFWEIVN